MEEDWDFVIPFQDAADADWKGIKNLPGEVHREAVTGQDKEGSAVKGRLSEIVHGYEAGEDSDPCTLIVFEWELVPGAGDNRFRNVQIDVVFAAHGKRSSMAPGDSLSRYDPYPFKIVPADPVTSLEALVKVTKNKENEFSGEAGYSPFVKVTPKHKDGKTWEYRYLDHRYISGSRKYGGQKNMGKFNAVQWVFRENVSLESGVQYRVNTAVLLRRQEDDFEQFTATVETGANVSPLKKKLQTPLKAIGLWPRDDPIFFDPTVTSGSKAPGKKKSDDIAARPTQHDDMNLGTVDLNEYLIEDTLKSEPEVEGTGNDEGKSVVRVEVAVVSEELKAK